MLLLMLLYVVLFAFVPSVIISGMFRAGMHSRLSPLWRVEAKINLLPEHAGIEFDPYKSLPQQSDDGLPHRHSEFSHLYHITQSGATISADLPTIRGRIDSPADVSTKSDKLLEPVRRQRRVDRSTGDRPRTTS